MNRPQLASILSSFKQRPWPLIPIFGVVPVVSILLISQARQAPVTESATPAIASPVALAPKPPLSPALMGPPAPQGPPAPKSTSKTATKPTKTTDKAAKPTATNSNSSKATAQAAKAQTPAKTEQQAAAQPQPQAAVSESAAQRLAEANAASAIDGALEIKVAIAMEINSLAIGTSTGGVIMDASGQVLQELPTETGYVAQIDGQGITMNGWQLPPTIYVEPNQGGLVYIGDRWYRGRLMLVVRPSGLLAINYVLLRDYLYSVVGAEVSPSWPIAALKAQAIAARSYALTYYFKPAHELYNLGDDEGYQVYAGVDKEADTTYQAVDETAGEFISYRGGIVESLYAASDDIVIEAHGGRGMSQLGALKLAEEGYDYRQILGTYYPGTGLARIEVDHE